MSSGQASLETKPSLKNIFGEGNEELNYLDSFED
jgi:hypothetical protein